ncbi:twitching motility protein PilT [Bacteroidia bacterium]|nr:twitching motility protein PilT [Bacteroidia bacterium]
MIRYLLDTHILVWLMKKNEKLNQNIREDIEYFQHFYYVSVETLREIVVLQSLKKIQLDATIEILVHYLEEAQIQILPIELNHINALEKLPYFTEKGKTHNDPCDRMLIAQSIAEKLTIVSSDSKFLPYRDFGLKLLVNEK